jgi:hypothetical protein
MKLLKFWDPETSVENVYTNCNISLHFNSVTLLSWQERVEHFDDEPCQQHEKYK